MKYCPIQSNERSTTAFERISLVAPLHGQRAQATIQRPSLRTKVVVVLIHLRIGPIVMSGEGAIGPLARTLLERHQNHQDALVPAKRTSRVTVNTDSPKMGSLLPHTVLVGEALPTTRGKVAVIINSPIINAYLAHVKMVDPVQDASSKESTATNTCIKTPSMKETAVVLPASERRANLALIFVVVKRNMSLALIRMALRASAA